MLRELDQRADAFAPRALAVGAQLRERELVAGVLGVFARQLLDAAGYKAGANGERFKLTIDYLPGGDDQQKNVAEYVRGQLK
ncbi:hypothetical protein, partial [Variovorax paradoxus]|uniref:hypothetical protein n=1 Tax=Variovorax paradoxus TaxID=34073 RepID=UPI002479A379